jgi:hypothetical protein
MFPKVNLTEKGLIYGFNDGAGDLKPIRKMVGAGEFELLPANL